MRIPRANPILEKSVEMYRLHFCLNSTQYKRHYIKDKREAELKQAEINYRVFCFKTGQIQLPEGVDLENFIFENITSVKELFKVPSISSTEPIFSAQIPNLFEFMEEYFNSTIKSKSENYQKTTIIHLNHLKKFCRAKKYGNIPLGKVTIKLFDEYKVYRSKEVGNDTINKELATFRSLFQKAKDYGYLKENIVKKVEKEQSQVPTSRFRTHSEILELIQHQGYSEKELKEIKRFRYLTEDEIQRLVRLSKDRWIYPIIAVLAHTGMRRGEAIDFRWSDICFKTETFHVRSKKESTKYEQKVRQIPIHKELFPILKTQKIKTGKIKWVFTGPNGGQVNQHSLQSMFKSIIKGTEFEGVGYHIFRHSIASNMSIKGVNQRFIDKILGHQTEEMKQRYQHLFPSKVKEILDNNISNLI